MANALLGAVTADCFSVAAADAALAAALLAYYTSSQVDTLLADYRTRTRRRPAPSRPRCWPTTPPHKWTRCWETTARRAQDTQTQAAIAGALLAYRTGPDQDVFTTNQITSALVAYRSAADQDTATASSIAAALLSYYTIAQVDGLLAGKLGVTEAASALQIAVRFPDEGGADEVVAAIGEQILAPTDVSLSNWTVRPSSGCSVVLATHTAGVSVDGYTLTLPANPWNIVRTYNLTSKALALICMLYRSSVPADCCTSPGIDPPKAPKCSFAIPPRGRQEVQARRAPDALRGRAEEGAGDAHVVVVGRADVHHQVGGRAPKE